MNLNNDERRQSGAIKALRYLKGRLDALRRRNDESMSPDERAVLLGEIAAVKGLIKFIETSPVDVPDQSQFDD